MKITFVMRQLGYVRLFDAPIRALLDEGHEVHLAYERELWTDRERAWLDEMLRRPGFTSGLTEALRLDPWFVPADRLRRIADYLAALAPESAETAAIVGQAEDRVHPAALRRVLRLLAGHEPTRKLLWRLVSGLEEVIPPSRAVERELHERGTDVLVVVPHVAPGNRQSEYIRAAAPAGVASVLAVASWDNLTTRQLLRARPDRLLVWNDVQRREALERHGMPAERIVVTGAQSFDEWFDRTPRPRDSFLEAVGLDARRPYALWVGGALHQAALTEAEFIAGEWLPRVRRDTRFEGLQLLVRPHPRRLSEWESFAPEDSDVAVWPRVGAAMPVDEESRAEYYDSMFHGAVVTGINTTAMIEAAIVGRPVLTILEPAFYASQEGAPHFKYLLTVGGGMLDAARTWEDHLDDLARALAGDDGEREREFVRQFVRPQGLDVPSLPVFVEALTSVERAPAEPASPVVAGLRAAFLATLAAGRWVARALRSRR